MMLKFKVLLGVAVFSVTGSGFVVAETVDPSSRLIGGLETTATKYEDTLVHMARKYNVGFVEMRAANPGVDPWLPGSGTKITIPTQHIVPDAPHTGVVINLPEMRMYYFFDPKEPPATYPIGIGRSGLTTPMGSTTVAHMSVDPIWRPTDRMRSEDPTLPAVVQPGPENPMGTHAMYLGWPSYAIHGTDKPYSIGRRLSSGCIRMYPEDIITLFDNVKVGTTITVVDQPVKTAWVGDKFYIQVHPTQEQSDTLSHDGMTKPEYPLLDADIQKIIKDAGDSGTSIDWAKMRTAVKERRGIPVVIASKTVAPIAPDVTSKTDGVSVEPLNADVKPDVKNDVKTNVKKESVPPKKSVKIKDMGVKKDGLKTHEKTSHGVVQHGAAKPKTISKDGMTPAHGVKAKTKE